MICFAPTYPYGRKRYVPYEAYRSCKIAWQAFDGIYH